MYDQLNQLNSCDLYQPENVFHISVLYRVSNLNVTMKCKDII